MKPRTLTPATRRRVAEIHVEIARLRREQARLTRLGIAVLLAILLCLFAPEATAAVNVGSFMGLPPCAPAAFPLAEVDVKGMTLGGLGLFATLIGYHFLFARYIRQQAGVKETQTTELAGQPIEVRAALKFITHPELEQQLEGYVSLQDLRGVEKALDDKIEGNFRDLDKKRSYSIGNLHEHLTGTTKSLTEKISAGDAKTHDRIEAMSNTLRAEFEAKLQSVREDITDLPGRLLTLLQQTGQIGQGGKR